MFGTHGLSGSASVFVAITIFAVPLHAHHSDAGIDMESITAFEGVVTEFAWRNPHVYVLIEVDDGNGDAVVWDAQMGPVNALSRRGWRRNTLVAGEAVSVRVHPQRDGRPYGIIESIDKAGGLGLVPAAGAAPTPASTTTLEGQWIADRSETMQYPGGFDGFFNALMTLNDNGRAAQAAYNPVSEENPEASCVGRPTPAALVSTSIYMMSIDIREDEEVIVLRSEYFDEERTVYMDGRGHPDPEQRFVTGHSIGSWDGDTLVVDTRNFEDHRSPYQTGVPSGGQKHVVERYSLTDDGTRIDLQFTLNDPEFMAAPMVHSRQLMYSPHMQMYPGECDPESTRRFLSN